MSSEKKIVFFDLDGTIYEIGKGTPDSSREALHRLRENGHCVILCTGRPVASLFPEMLELEHDGIIAGAGTYAEYGGKILRNELLPNSLLLNMIPRLEKAGCCVVLEGPEYLSCRMEGEAFTSVSYTHLDVYKRQRLGRRTCPCMC